MRTIAVLLFLAVVPAIAHAQSPDTVLLSASAGVYTEDQANRGKVVLEMHCASCHSSTYHNDEAFRTRWFGKTVYALFRVLKTTMPEDNVGGLSDDDYTRAIAYILQLNGFPAGKDSLKADSAAMAKVKIGRQ